MIFIYYDKKLMNVALSNYLDLKHFGDIQIGKKSLRQSFFDLITPYYKFTIVTDLAELSEVDEPYILWSSDITTTDWQKVITLCKKMSFSNDKIEVKCGTSKLTFIPYGNDKDVLYLDKENYLVQIQNVHDLTALAHENLFFRYFNQLKVDGKKIIKQSQYKEKIRAEYSFLSSIPISLKSYFAEVTDYKEYNDSAVYAVQKYDMLDCSVLYLHGGLNGKDFTEFLKLISGFLNEKQKYTNQSSPNNIDSLLIKKVQDRSEQLRQWIGYSGLNKFIHEYTAYRSFEDVLDKLFETVKKYKNKLDQYPNVFSHGDLCLSNILYDKNNQIIKLIDPKGDQYSYLPSIYDIAKLSHSILGGYDHIVNQNSTIDFTSNMEVVSQIQIAHENVSLFRQFLTNSNIEYQHVRLVEASLFLSMLPLHTDDRRKVFLLSIRGIEILNKIR